MQIELKATTLRNCLEKVIDYRGKTPKKLGSDWTNKGYRALSANNVKDSGLDSIETIRCVDAETYKRWMKEEVRRGDILLTSEAPAGEAMIWESDEKIVLGQRLFGLRVNDHFDNRFIKYYLQSSTGKREVSRTRSGSTVAGISVEMFDQIQVLHPNMDMQRKIGAILSGLDAKIKLNNRINKELEALAKTIYDYWFVQFDFPFDFAKGRPDAHGRPYKSSGGAMAWNDILKREIPAGWEADNICAVALLLGGGTPSKTHPEYWNGNIPFFTPADAAHAMFQLDTTDHITDQGLKSCSSDEFDKGTVFITARGSVGKVVIAGRNMAMNQSCYALRAKADEHIPFVYFHAHTLVHHLKVKASGSTFNSIVTNDIDWTSLVAPPAAVIEAFGTKTRSMFGRIEAGLHENEQLTQLRDWLLPLLMNGQVRVA